MSKRNLKLVFCRNGTGTALALLIVAACSRIRPVGTSPAEWSDTRRLPRIRPDYSQTVIPPNIAPLNFLVEEPGAEYRVRIHGTGSKDILIASRSPSIVIPLRPWRELLDKNRGGRIGLDIYVKGKDGPVVPLWHDRERRRPGGN